VVGIAKFARSELQVDANFAITTLALRVAGLKRKLAADFL